MKRGNLRQVTQNSLIKAYKYILNMIKQYSLEQVKQNNALRAWIILFIMHYTASFRMIQLCVTESDI